MIIGVTGVAGSIGSELQRQLVQQGFSVKGIENRCSHESYFYGDIRSAEAVHNFIQDCDGIIHLAAVSRVATADTNPQETFAINTNATYRLAKAAQSSPKKPWLIFASSKEVYGDQAVPLYQEDLPLRPKSIYGESKKAAEQLLMQNELSSLPKAILRFSNVYGSSVDHTDRLIPSLVYSAIERKSITLHGAKRLFDLIHVQDVASAVLMLIERFSRNRESLPPMNINYGESYSLREIAHTIMNLSTSLPQASSSLSQLATIKETEHNGNDLNGYCGSIQRASEQLHWLPKVNLREGLQRTIRLYAEQRSLRQEKKEIV